MTPDDLKVSVVVPLHNGAPFIGRALDSIFRQSLLPTEVIVVDDGSTDASLSIVEGYQEAHQLVLLQQRNKGRAAAQNFGVRHSSGHLIALLNQGDVWYPHHLRELSRPFREDDGETVGWSYSNFDEITEDNRLRVRSALSIANMPHPKMALHEVLGEDVIVPSSASIIGREAFNTAGGFDEEIDDYEEEDLFVRIFVARYRNVYTDKALSQCRTHPTSARYPLATVCSRIRYARKLLGSFADEPSYHRYYARDYIAPRFLAGAVETARLALRSGNQDAIKRSFEDIAFLEGYVAPSLAHFPLRRELLITAIIPLYNGAMFIRSAIQSLLDQERVPDEIIVVDDGSTDGGPDLVMEIASKYPIRLLRQANAGQSSARNTGVDHAHGDLIAFLDQDDVWYPNHLSELVKPFLEIRSAELGWCYSDLDEINEGGQMVSRAVLSSTNSQHPKRSLVACLQQDMFVLPSASLISRRAFQIVGGFDEHLSGYEDDDLFLRLFQAGFENVFVKNALSKWRIHRKSSSYSPRMAASRAIYARMLIDRFPDDPDLGRHYVADLIAPRFFRLMATELRKAVLDGRPDQQKLAINNLVTIVDYLRASRRVPLQTIFLPAMHNRLLARFIMRYRVLLYSVLWAIFGRRGI